MRAASRDRRNQQSDEALPISRGLAPRVPARCHYCCQDTCPAAHGCRTCKQGFNGWPLRLTLQPKVLVTSTRPTWPNMTCFAGHAPSHPDDSVCRQVVVQLLADLYELLSCVPLRIVAGLVHQDASQHHGQAAQAGRIAQQEEGMAAEVLCSHPPVLRRQADPDQVAGQQVLDAAGDALKAGQVPIHHLQCRSADGTITAAAGAHRSGGRTQQSYPMSNSCQARCFRAAAVQLLELAYGSCRWVHAGIVAPLTAHNRDGRVQQVCPLAVCILCGT